MRQKTSAARAERWELAQRRRGKSRRWRVAEGGERSMAEPYVDLRFDAQGQLRIELTPAGAAFAREELGLRFDPDGALPHAARERYERYGADRALAELLAYPLGNGWELTSSDEIGGLVSAEAPIVSDSLVRDERGVVRWFRSIYWYSEYQIHDPVIELARHGVVVFAQECDLIFSGRSIDITRQRDDTLLLELTASGRRWLDADEFEYPPFDELLEDHLQGIWTYAVNGETHTLANPYDGVFAFHGAPQLTLDQTGRLLMRKHVPRA
jgi:hypothetical protein